MDIGSSDSYIYDDNKELRNAILQKRMSKIQQPQSKIDMAIEKIKCASKNLLIVEARRKKKDVSSLNFLQLVQLSCDFI